MQISLFLNKRPSGFRIALLAVTLLILGLSACDRIGSSSPESSITKAVEMLMSAPVPSGSFTFDGSEVEVKNIVSLVEALRKAGMVEVQSYTISSAGDRISVSMTVTSVGQASVAAQFLNANQEIVLFKTGSRSVVRFLPSEEGPKSSSTGRCVEFVAIESPNDLGRELGLEVQAVRGRAEVRFDRFLKREIVVRIESGELGVDGWRDIVWLDEESKVQRGRKKGVSIDSKPCGS